VKPIKTIAIAALALLTSCFTGRSRKAREVSSITPPMSIYDFSIATLDGSKTINLADYKGKKMLLVNVASECGFTPQYTGLQELHNLFSDSLVIIGFPCNQFGGQEPGTAEEIIDFCSKNYDVSFQLTEKIDVKGKNQHEIYSWLTSKSKNGSLDSEVKWNFNKYLINEEGVLTNYYGSSVAPLSEEILSVIK
jgi:glutathione peroxidase